MSSTEAPNQEDVNFIRERFFEKVHQLAQDDRFFNELNSKISSAIDNKINNWTESSDARNAGIEPNSSEVDELRQYMNNEFDYTGEKKQELLDSITSPERKANIQEGFRIYIDTLLGGSDDDMIRALSELFYALFIEPKAIHKIHVAINEITERKLSSTPGSISGCQMTGCLDNLIGRDLPSGLSSMEVSVMKNNQDLVPIEGQEQSVSGYEFYKGIKGWNGLGVIELQGTESSGCKNDINLYDARELCDSSPECDGFFSYSRNQNDRVCFKKNVDTSKNEEVATENWKKEYNAPNSGFYLKHDMANGDDTVNEPFSNIEEVHDNKGILEDDNAFGNIITTLLFIILAYYLCKNLKLF